MINKLISMEKAVSMIDDGAVLMIGGFMACGTPLGIIDAIIDKGVKDLTIISNDTAMPEIGIGKLIVNKQVKRVIASHIGTNKETVRQVTSGDIEMDFVPQGTLAERIRAAGYGLGGILTPTGIGTLMEEEKEIIEIDKVRYILEKPIKADISLISGSLVDKNGNSFFNATTNNFNQVMATAADITIVEAKKVVEVGKLDPNYVMTPGIFIDYIVEGAS